MRAAFSPQIDQDTARPPLIERAIRTLVIEDSEFDQKRILRVCDETGLDFEICTLDGLEQLRAQLDAQNFDLALVDYRLMDSDGLEAVRRIRGHPAQVNSAILMLTGQGEMGLAIDAMKAGCSDFLDKASLTPAGLRRAVLNAMEKSLLHQDLMRARGLNDKLAELVQQFAKDSASEMKPLVLGLMRQARAQGNAPFKGRTAEAVEMDITCRKLWRMIEAMEHSAHRIE